MSKFYFNIVIKWNDNISFPYKFSNETELYNISDYLYNSLIELSSDYKLIDFGNINLYTCNRNQIYYLFDNKSLENITGDNRIIYCDYPKDDKEILFLNLLNEYEYLEYNIWVNNIYNEIENLKSLHFTFKICDYIFQIVNKLSFNEYDDIEYELLKYLSKISELSAYLLTYFYNITYNIDVNNNENENMEKLKYFILFLITYFKATHDKFPDLPYNKIQREISRIREKLDEEIVKLYENNIYDKYIDESYFNSRGNYLNYYFMLRDKYFFDILDDYYYYTNGSMIMPSEVEINTSKDITLNKLKENKVNGYESLDDYITTHYELLRADVLIPFQEAIQV